MSAKELRDKLKALRAQHAGKAIGKMSADEISKEISHHETACRAAEIKEKRMAGLAKAREARMAPKKEEKKKKVTYDSDSSSSSEEVIIRKKKGETIGDRIEKKKERKNE
jgi:hypothetical protein